MLKINQYGLPDGIEDSSELNLAVQLNKIKVQ